MENTKSNTFLEQSQEIIKKSCARFLAAVHQETNNPLTGFRAKGYKTDFPVIVPAMDQFSELYYYEMSIQEHVRDILVTDTLCNLLVLYGFEIIVPRRKLKGSLVYKGVNEFEKDNSFEFFALRKKEKSIWPTFLGIRYTAPQIDKGLTDKIAHKISKTVQIDFSEAENRHCSTDTPHFECVTLKEFFEEYISCEIYDMFVNTAREAVEEARQYIGYQTVKELNPRNLSEYRETKKREYASYQYDQMRYTKVEEQRSVCLSQSDIDIMNQQFIGLQLYRILTGDDRVGQCFLTSEYLFESFKHKGQFDYTAIVSGYLKSIELLLHRTIMAKLGKYDNLYITAKFEPKDVPRTDYYRKGHYWKIRFLKQYENLFNTSLGSLVAFIKDDKENWNISNEGYSVIRECLDDYNKFCRNEHFHKDVLFSDIEKVNTIRLNTIALFYMILGAYNISLIKRELPSVFGITDSKFEKIVFCLKSNVLSYDKLTLQFENQEPIKVMCPKNQPTPHFDEMGHIINTILLFAVIDDITAQTINDPFDDPKTIIIEVTPDNIPTHAWSDWQMKKQLF